MKKAKHFLHISDYENDELWEILHLSREVKEKFRNREDYAPFRNKSLAMIFAKPSARTRVSFETGFEWMGGQMGRVRQEIYFFLLVNIKGWTLQVNTTCALSS